MSPFWDTILSTAIGAIFGGSGVTLLTFLIARHDKKNDKHSKEYEELSDKIRTLGDAIRGQGHDRIIHLGGKYLERGGLTHEEYENLNDYIYQPYVNLGGNGTARRVMDEVNNLPILLPDEAVRRDKILKTDGDRDWMK